MKKYLSMIVLIILAGCGGAGCASGVGYEFRTPSQRFKKMESLTQQYIRVAYPVPPLSETANSLQIQLHERKVNQRAEKIEKVQMGLSVYSTFIKALYGDGVYDDEIDIRVVAIKLASYKLKEGIDVPVEELDRIRGTLTFLDILGVKVIKPYMSTFGAKSVDVITEELSKEEVLVK